MLTFLEFVDILNRNGIELSDVQIADNWNSYKTPTFEVPLTGPYFAQCARDAKESGYGGESYADYLETSSLQSYVRFAEKGDMVTARLMLTRDLGEALAGNNGN